MLGSPSSHWLGCDLVVTPRFGAGPFIGINTIKLPDHRMLRGRTSYTPAKLHLSLYANPHCPLAPMASPVLFILRGVAAWLASYVFYNAPTAAAQSARRCYTPRGDMLGDYVPCHNQGDSDCCQELDACLSNGLCFSAREGLIYRGGCTRRDWETNSCRQMCPRCQFCFLRSGTTVICCFWQQFAHMSVEAVIIPRVMMVFL
jgi:hypothetical protein